MHTLEKIPKPKRFDVHAKKIAGSSYLDATDAAKLLSGKVVVEEKMDGKTARIETPHFTIFAEDLKVKHSVSYRVPARFAIYDVFDKKRGVILGLEGKIDVYRDLKNLPGFFKDGVSSDIRAAFSPASFFLVQILERGFFKLEELPPLIKISSYGAEKETWMEGIVVKSIADAFPFELRSGKLVRTEFVEGIKVHYSRLKKFFNIIDPAVPEINPIVQDSPRIPRNIKYKIDCGRN
jgi:hypothetical protein